MPIHKNKVQRIKNIEPLINIRINDYRYTKTKHEIRNTELSKY